MTDKDIAKRLGVTAAGLRYLARCVAGRSGLRGSEGVRLERQGYLKDGYITEAGRKIVARARAEGW